MIKDEARGALTRDNVRSASSKPSSGLQRWMPTLLAVWGTVAVGRIFVATSMSPVSYVLLGVIWLLSAVILVIAVRLLVVAETAERRFEAFCLGLMMAALLVQGVIGGDKTIGITTPLVSFSLVALVYIYVRRWRRRARQGSS